MPLEHSPTPAALHRNMHTLFADIGKSPHVQSRKQAVAIALETQRRAAAGKAAGGVVPHFDVGGATTDPVTAVINALSAGAGTAGVASPPGTTNPSAPSSVSSTVSTSPPAANTQAQGVAPSSTTGANPATTANAAAAGVMPTPNNPIQQRLMARGGALKRAGGGFNMAQGPNLRPPWFERSEARQLHVGPVVSNVPGRTDNHRVKVPAGSYVLPSTHVAAMGHGNTMAGVSIADKMFGGPYGTSVPRLAHGHLPRPPRPMISFASGGAYSEGGSRGSDHFEPVDVDIAGGEYVIPPQAIIRRFGSLKAGHKALDAWVMALRKKEVKTLKRLPPPAKR